MKRFLRWVLIALSVVVLAGTVAIGSLGVPYQPSHGDVFVDLQRGSGTISMARALADAGVIRYSWQFWLARMLHPSARMQAGEYRFAEPSSALTVFDRICRGDIYYFEFTIPEGSNRFDIARLLAATSTISSEDFLLASADPSMIQDLAPHAPSLEGFLFPSTYRLSHSTTAQDLCRQMTAEFRRQWKKFGNPGTDVSRAVTLASLIEKETGTAEERPLVSSVFTNRLSKGMKLDCDPTTIYAALLDHRYSGVIHRSDLDSLNPYNTYQHAGLPPGPIANPGASSIQAALHPAETNYLFFVAKPEGGSHTFSATREAHEKAVAAYRKTQQRPLTKHPSRKAG